MNKDRREKLAAAVNLLVQAKEIITIVKDGEQDAYDNMPEGLQSSERGEKMESNISELEDIESSIDEHIQTIETVSE